MWQQIVRSIAVIIVTAAVLGRANEAYSEPTTKVPSMPLTFTENLGQWDECVHFRANAGGATMWITGDGVHYQFVRQTPVTELLVINTIFVGADPDP